MENEIKNHDLYSNQQQYIKKELENVDVLKKDVSLKAAKLKEDLLKLIKESSESNASFLEDYEKMLKSDLETLNPNQKAFSMKEILETAKKAEAVLQKNTIPLQFTSDNLSISSNIQKILEDNFTTDNTSKINVPKKNQLLLKIESEFSPIFSFFGIEPSQNFLKDYIKLQKYSKQEVNFTEHILKYIFDYYDKVIVKIIKIRTRMDILTKRN
jgi:hypothetical protein